MKQTIIKDLSTVHACAERKLEAVAKKHVSTSQWQTTNFKCFNHLYHKVHDQAEKCLTIKA
jgi:hypothetical protein